MLSFNKAEKYNLGFYLLMALLLFLPNFEAPKNIILVLFVLVFFYEQRKNSQGNTKWMPIDYIFLIWILLDIVVGLNAIIFHDMPANGSKDLLKFLIFGWIISRSFYTDRQVALLLLAVVLSVFIPSILLLFSCAEGGRCVELNSVGHVNHTAIFLVSVYAILLSFLYFNFNRIRLPYRIFYITTLVLLAYIVTISVSRASFGLLVVVSILTVMHYIISKKKFIELLVLLFCGFVLLFNMDIKSVPVVAKFENTSILGGEGRQKIRDFSYYAFKTNPILGVGFGNFIKLGHDDIRDAVVKDKGLYDKSMYWPFAHPHNVYYTYLVSGGLIITSIFLVFWLYFFKNLYQLGKRKNERWLTMSGVYLSMIVLGIGWVNTTFAHEGALLTMLIAGMVFSKNRQNIPVKQA